MMEALVMDAGSEVFSVKRAVCTSLPLAMIEGRSIIKELKVEALALAGISTIVQASRKIANNIVRVNRLAIDRRLKYTVEP